MRRLLCYLCGATALAYRCIATGCFTDSMYALYALACALVAWLHVYKSYGWKPRRQTLGNPTQVYSTSLTWLRHSVVKPNTALRYIPTSVYSHLDLVQSFIYKIH